MRRFNSRAQRVARGKSWQRRALALVPLAGSLMLGTAVAPSVALAGGGQSKGGGTATSVPLSQAPAGGFDPATDMGSLYNIDRIINADDAWKAGYTGNGVDVALIDSGVAPVQGLTSGNVVNGPDLSFDSQVPELTNLDGFGHGTHMAGLIAGRDVEMSPSKYASAPASQFTGVAPDARIISIKAGAHDGSVDVSQVIAAINWATEHAHTNGNNIRVISLSYGTDSTQASQVDPLAFAVEQAWKAGIVVVVAGGNDGTPAKVLANPAYDPYVLAVGADDPQNTLSYVDDTVPDFTSRGTNDRHVDLVAPGAHVAGLRVPGSVVDVAHPDAVVGDRYLRGSGTSQATAVVAGAAAIFLQKYPRATPDQVKKQLMSTAHSFDSATNVYRGNGLIDVYAAVTAKLNTSNQSPQFFGDGSGSLELARGSAHVFDGDTELTGEQDIFGTPWDGKTWSTAAAMGKTWSAGTWNGKTWSGSDWSGSSWSGKTWSDATWSDATWSGKTWSDSTWSGKTWSGKTWSDGDWSGKTWSGKTWSDSVWADAVWQ